MLNQLINEIIPIQLTKKIMFSIICLTVIPMMIMAVVMPIGIIKIGKKEQEKMLYAVVDRLDDSLTQSYSEILDSHGASSKDINEQVKVLNSVLQPILNEVYDSTLDVGIGYYSIELDHIVAIAPNFEPSKLIRVNHEQYPYFTIYNSGKPEFGEFNNSFGWNGKPILYYAKPIYHNGKIIGHVWANIKTDDIYNKALHDTVLVISIWLCIIGLVLAIAYKISKNLHLEMKRFAKAFVSDENLPTSFMPEFIPIFDKIKEHSANLKKANLLLHNEIEERKNIEEKLKDSEETFRNIFDNSVDGIFLAKPEGKILAANPAICQMLGMSEEEICRLGSSGVVSIQESDLYQILKERRRNLPIRCELNLIHKDGLKIPVEATSKIYKNSKGEELICIFVRDISQRLQTQQEMARLDRLNLIGQMAAGIGHEVRNPMTTVRGFLQMLSTKEACAQYKEYYLLMIDELDRANSIITQFLSLARSTPLDLQFHNLNQIIDDLYPLLQANALNSNNNVIVEKFPIPEIEINKNEIHQLILNLVSNGLDAMGEGGQVTIRIFTDNKDLILAIKDEGSGIAPEVLERIGTPFLTTKEHGTGLGLATCYSIAERNNAKIEVASSTSGTTFFVKFKIG
ncbi:two-component system sensor histidine kinase NtrB [Desulforamulus aeronauticus]|uniref:histidine kinase n=1 Tax=Desulforamulus aeronauticus DSM 10349 TaxID=1121421 RepID=A0A1M6UQ75_9FIRM|nr:PAS domain S-box protein [Desulforamulus aeronauticus]SHK71325.1 PAS domain S-box-containing protein [Desulforamulus aeronauticus DSM 10349]